jgi:guanine deaminase
MAHVYKGTFLFTPTPWRLTVYEDSYMLVEDGLVSAIEPELPEAWKDKPFTDFGDRFVIPGFTDLHFHAVQYVNRGLGHDKPLLEWLEAYTFPEEIRFFDEEYAKQVFRDVVFDLWQNGTLHSSAYSNISAKTTHLLMDLIEEAGLYAYVGKVNMDRHGGDLTETTEDSYNETLRFIEYESERVKPIITPRFTPACSMRLMTKLGQLAEEKDLAIQSHLNETPSEVEWVKELCPECKDYIETYTKAGLVRPYKTIMAHCIYNSKDERARMLELGIFLAHCPSSNTNLTSGVMPVAELLAEGQRIGLGSDISGGDQFFMPKVITEAVKASKLLAVLTDNPEAAIDEVAAFNLATRGGGLFFGRRGSFEPGFAFDALVIDDSALTKYRPLTPTERLHKWLYLGKPEQIAERYVDGELVMMPGFAL